MLVAVIVIIKITRPNSYLTKLKVLLENLTVVQLVTKVPAFIKHVYSSPSSQEPTTEPV
jgi:hypothetical protein